MIRTILSCLFLLLAAIISLPLLLIMWVISRFRPQIRERFSFYYIRFLAKMLVIIAGTRLTVIGEEKVPRDTPVLYVPNHRSYYDIFLVLAKTFRPSAIVAKIELAKIPILKSWMDYMHCLFLDRNDIRQGMQTILTATEYARNGLSIIIFPEGTRGKDPDETNLLPFHEGSFRIAARSGCPVVPVAINNTREILESHIPFVRSRRIILEYCDPIYPEELSPKDKKHLGEMSSERIRSALEKNKKLL